LAVCSFLLAGCGGSEREKAPKGNVSGTVTYEGKPVEKGRVQLSNPKTGIAAMAKIQEGGKFTLEQPIETGTYVVTVLLPESPPPGEGDPVDPEDFPNIPQFYQEEMYSDIKAEVKEGDNTIPVKMVAGKKISAGGGQAP
jgi:hypothetical protein